MSGGDIELRVRKVIAERTEVSLEDVSLDHTRDELNIDSMKMVDIIFSLEEEFDVMLEFNANSDSQLGSNMSRVSDFVEWIKMQIHEKS